VSGGPGRLAAAAAAALLALAGCRSVPTALPPLASEDPRPVALLGRLAMLGAERTALRASARVSIEGQRRAAFAKQLLLLQRPARLRLEVLGVLGQRALVLATDGAHYDLYRAERPGIETGDVHPGILYEVAGLALTPEEAVQLALGAPLAPGEEGAAAGAAALPDGGVRVELRAREGDPRRTLDFAPGGELARYAVHGADGALLFDARYGDYRDVAGTPFAHAVEVDLPPTESHAEIRFQWVELNPPLSDDLFRLPHAGPGAGTPWRPSAS
jgi:hypothetical protein